MMKSIEQQNTETVAAFIEAFWNESRFDCMDRYLSPDYQEHSYQLRDGLKQFAGKILEAFPDNAVEESIAQEEQVLVRMTVKGTHQGMFFGTEPTGRTIDVTLYRQYRVTGGKIAEHRGLDRYGDDVEPNPRGCLAVPFHCRT
ncbi:ester cyclase [Paenibacillus doosanensis]|uniref:SnoaL-like polyketide cyclase n=1 Tax=Paenibacillus konkukensis TaxID=2020716 RepID=A0ABY4RVS9_9BACL|nr:MULTISPECIES: ester cyclase [Paenibacillus]MCS7460993.1 ester cyclase [Paenibacillus doosanensis]UQZ85663.1 SnoaL-like polyketide cyclase [Paenibacillus konkukensis]